MPIAEAWHAGAWRWSHERQIAIGNDVDYRWDLRAVTSSLNQDKGDKDPARWMPRKNRCAYAKAWIGVKYRWSLTVDRAERAALARDLTGCDGALALLRPGRPDVTRLAGLHSRHPAAAVVDPVISDPVELAEPTSTSTPTVVPVVQPTATPTPSATSPATVSFANCTAARAAGAAPLYRGGPGYRSALVRDDDAVACET